MLDMTAVVNDPAFVEPLQLRRYTVGGWVDGIWQQPGYSVVTFQGSSEPATKEVLAFLPEGERNKTIRMFFTSQQVLTSDNNRPADVIIDHLGADWKVMQLGDWSSHGAYDFLAERLPVGSPSNPVQPPQALVQGIQLDFDFKQSRIFDASGDPITGAGADAYSFLDATINQVSAVTASPNSPTWQSYPYVTFGGEWYTLGTQTTLNYVLGTFTLFMVFRPDAAIPQQIFCIGDPFGSQEGLSIQIQPTGMAFLRQNPLGGVDSATAVGTVATGAPSVWAVSISSDGIKALFHDGTALYEDEQNILSLIALNPSEFFLGSCDGTEPFSGDMYRVIGYDRELTDDEINQNVAYLLEVYGI